MEPAERVNSKFVEEVLALRVDSRARADLRRGWDEVSEHYAYPYLAYSWARRPYLKNPHLTFAALAATAPQVGSADSPLGQLARLLVLRGLLSEDNLRRKLVAAQGLSLRQARSFFRQLLVCANKHGFGVDWASVYWMLRRWDHPDVTVRRETRQRLLEDYFTSTDSQDKERGVSASTAAPTV